MWENLKLGFCYFCSPHCDLMIFSVIISIIAITAPVTVCAMLWHFTVFWMCSGWCWWNSSWDCTTLCWAVLKVKVVILQRMKIVVTVFYCQNYILNADAIFLTNAYCIYWNKRWGFFPEIWLLNMCGCLKFTYKTLNLTVPTQVALNGIMPSQTKASITKSSCEICTLVRYYTA